MLLTKRLSSVAFGELLSLNLLGIDVFSQCKPKEVYMPDSIGDLLKTVVPSVKFVRTTTDKA